MLAVIVELLEEETRRLVRQEIPQAYSAELAELYLAAGEQRAQATLRRAALLRVEPASQAWQWDRLARAFFAPIRQL